MDLTAPLFFITVILLMFFIAINLLTISGLLYRRVLPELTSLKDKLPKKKPYFPKLGSVWRYKKREPFICTKYTIIGHVTKDYILQGEPISLPSTAYAVRVYDMELSKEEDIELSLFLSLCEPDV